MGGGSVIQNGFPLIGNRAFDWLVQIRAKSEQICKAFNGSRLDVQNIQPVLSANANAAVMSRETWLLALTDLSERRFCKIKSFQFILIVLNKLFCFFKKPRSGVLWCT